MAYGDDLKLLEAVIELKMNSLHKSDKSSDSTSTTSLNSIIEPLKQLNRNLCQCRSFNLFKAVLDLPDEKSDVSFFIFRLRQLITLFLKYEIIIV